MSILLRYLLRLINGDGKPELQQNPEPKDLPWPEFLRVATDQQAQTRLTEEIRTLTSEFKDKLRPFCFLSLYDSRDSIDSWESDRIYTALQAMDSLAMTRMCFFCC